MEALPPTQAHGVPNSEVRVEFAVRWIAAACLLGAGAVHAAFISSHLRDHTSHGIFFALVALAQVLLALAVLRSARRWVFSVAAASGIAVIAVWVVSRTVGIGGEVEPVGLADVVSTSLEAVVVVGFALCLRPALAQRRLPALRAGATLGVAAVGVLALVVPSVTVGPSQHQHQHHDPSATEAAAQPGHDMTGHAMTGNDMGSHDMAPHDVVSAVPVGSSAAPMAHHHAKVPCPNPTAAQQQAADTLIQDTKRATARLANVDTAKAEGYMRFGDGDIAGTWHYINWKYQADSAVLDPTHPESIIYWQASPNSPLYLIGVMYITPRAGMAGPQVAGCLTQWHSHGAPFAPEGVATPEMLHVWFVPLPGGPFVTDPSHPEE